MHKSIDMCFHALLFWIFVFLGAFLKKNIDTLLWEAFHLSIFLGPCLNVGSVIHFSSESYYSFTLYFRNKPPSFSYVLFGHKHWGCHFCLCNHD